MSSKSDARDGSAGASSSDLLQLQVFGHAGHVKLQQAVGNQQALVRHCITLETAELPHAADGWTLVFEKTFGAVCNTSSDVVIELDDLFKKQLCTDAKGHFFVVEQLQNMQQKVWSLREKQCMFKDVKVQFALGPTKAAHHLQCSLLGFPRAAGSRFFWHVHPLYSMLGLTGFGGCPSKWSWTQSDRWIKRLAALGFTGQVLYSNQTVVKESDAAQPDAFLPGTSLSTLALVEELARWCCLPAHQGGLRSQECKEAANAVLSAFCKESLTNRAFMMKLSFVDDGSCTWPLDVPEGDVQLSVHDGRVSVDAWAKLVSAPATCDPIALKWWKNMGFVEGQTVIPICSFLKRALIGCKALFSHALYQTAKAIEGALYTVLHSQNDKIKPPIKASFLSLFDCLDNNAALSQGLLKHVMTGVAVTPRYSSVSLASDKASVCGLSLDAGGLFWPNNQAAVAVPQAVVV